VAAEVVEDDDTDGRQPAAFSASALLQASRRSLPPDWRRQRDALGIR
jgi:hypothetical protein